MHVLDSNELLSKLTDGLPEKTLQDITTNRTFMYGLHLDYVVWGRNDDQRGYLASSLRGHYAGLIHSVLDANNLAVSFNGRLVELIRSSWFPAVIEATPAEAIRALETKMNSFSLRDKSYHSQYYAGAMVTADKLKNAILTLAESVRELDNFREFTVYVVHGTDALDALIQGHGTR